jgi:hypothetical protein
LIIPFESVLIKRALFGKYELFWSNVVLPSVKLNESTCDDETGKPVANMEFSPSRTVDGRFAVNGVATVNEPEIAHSETHE